MMEENDFDEESEKTDCLYCFIWILLGGLIIGVGLAVILTMYIDKRTSTNQSTSSTVTTVTSTTSTTSTASTTSTSTTSTTTTTTTTTQANSSKYYCGGISSYTQWQLATDNGIFMHIDTSSCAFSSTPVYYVSVGGTGNQHQLGGYEAIYLLTTTSFRVYAHPLFYWNHTLMLADSQTYQWNVNWFGLIN